MKALKISFDLTVSPRLARCGLAGLLVLASAPNLSSETVSLSTYYPSPSGVYTQMITAGNTYLARDTGNVGIGTTGPLTAKLEVPGHVLLSAASPQLSFGAGVDTAKISLLPGGILAIKTKNAERLRVDPAIGSVIIGGLPAVEPTKVMKLDVNGDAAIVSGACTLRLFPCLGTEYAAVLPGVIAHFQTDVSPRLGTDAPTISCCPCPGACLPMPP